MTAKKVKGGYVPKSMQKAHFATMTLAPTAQMLAVANKSMVRKSSKV